MKHRGPVCAQCRREFYYDYLEQPNEPFTRSGLCWECWAAQAHYTYQLCACGLETRVRCVEVGCPDAKESKR